MNKPGLFRCIRNSERLAYTLLALSLCLPAMADEWIDITDAYITNPSFVGNNYSGWSGTAWGSANPKENAEHYQMNYDTYQKITGLKAGSYRVSLNAFYRMGDSGNDYSLYSSGSYSSYQYAQLYATSSINEYTSRIQCASQGKSTTQLGGSCSGVGNQTGGGWWGGTYEYYIPNNMEAAYYWFQAGYYKNLVLCQVGEDGELTIGIRKSTTLSGDWTCCDDWKLEYYGTVTKATGVTLSMSSLSMVPSQITQITATVLPADATYHKVTWSSSNTSVATVDAEGNVTAIAEGSATITATAADGSGVKSTCSVTVKAPSSPSSSNIIINEIMANNIDVYRDPSTNYGAWVELYNPTDEGVKLGGLYITDECNNLKKYRLVDDYGALPGHGFALLHFDHHSNFQKTSFRQIDFKLDVEGDTIIISDGNSIFARQIYPEAIGRTSYARTEDGAGSWGTTGNPTPGASNRTSTFATDQLAAPVPDHQSQLFSSTFTLKVTVPSGATLRYTTDGTTPTLTNGETSTDGTFNVNGNTCLRFRAFQNGMLPSNVVTRSFIHNNGNEPFPIISIVADNSELFDTSSPYGVYAYSDNGRSGNGQTSAYNANMEWDRPVNFDYIPASSTSAGVSIATLSQQCDFSACGGWSRAYEPHSFKLKAGKQYDGLNSLDAQFFTDKPYNKHKSLQIRNGGNDNGCRIKDAALQKLVSTSGLYVDHQAWQPVHVYVNGESYAVLNMREPNNKHNGYSNYGIDMDYIEQFEIGPDSGYIQMEGTGEQFQKLYNLSKTASNANSYEEICKLVDVDELVNYLSVIFCYGNWDWPQNNVKGYCNMADGADHRMHFVIFDLDGSFNTTTPLSLFAGKQNYTFDNLHGYDYSKGKSIEGTHITKENPFVTIVVNLLKNATFKKKFIDAFMIVNHNVITPERASSIISEASNYLAQGGYVYPSSTANSIISSISASRQTSLDSHIQSYFGLSAAQSVTLKSNVQDGAFLIDGMAVPCGDFSGKLFYPATITAKAPAGYIFKGWKASSGGNTTTTDIFSASSTWKYYTSSLDGISWQDASYSDTSWGSGAAPLGYSSGNNESTHLTKNLCCYYFRKDFTLDNVSASDTYTLNYTIDDGMVVYVNGKEAGRYNMPSGTTSFTSVASTYANGNPDTGTMNIAANLLHKGSNVIAVEVHNNQASSSDIRWDASLQRISTVEGMSSYVSTDVNYNMPSSGSISLIADWEKVDSDLQVQYADVPVKINEVSANNDVNVSELFKKGDWIELYNTTDMDINAAGLYLSDNLNKPQKYQITSPPGAGSSLPTGEGRGEATIIPAHGTLLVWCDKKTGTSQIHTNFKLDNADGCVVLLSGSEEFAKNNPQLSSLDSRLATFTDTLRYCVMNTAQSVCRYPDGANAYYLTSYTTIDNANVLQASDTLVGIDSIDPIRLGDVDGDGKITQTDARLIMQHYLDTLPASAKFNTNKADVNKDSRITINDANIVVNKAK